MSDDDLLAVFARHDLPAAFERWSIELAAGAERPSAAGEWVDVVVLVQLGTVEVECRSGGRRAFRAGDLIVPAWLPLRALRNPGQAPARLLALRRRRTSPRRLSEQIE